MGLARMQVDFKTGTFHIGDCLKIMPRLGSGIVDMVLCDLPYGTTRNKWDIVIPFNRLRQNYYNLCRPKAAMVLTAQQPFTSALVASNFERFSQAMVWTKNKSSGHLN